MDKLISQLQEQQLRPRVVEEHGAAEYDTSIGLTCLCSGRLHNRLLHQTIESSRTADAETAALVSSKHLMTSNW